MIYLLLWKNCYVSHIHCVHGNIHRVVFQLSAGEFNIFFKKEHYLCFLYKENPFPTASGQIQDYLNRSQRHVYLESMK